MEEFKFIGKTLVRGATSLANAARAAIDPASAADVLAEEATSDDHWGPTGGQLEGLAAETRKSAETRERVLWVLFRRLTEEVPANPKLWRRALKTLACVEYLLGHGSPEAVQAMRSNAFLDAVQSLQSHKYVNTRGIDRGAGVRKKAIDVLALLVDVDAIKQARRTAAVTLAHLTGRRTSFDDSSSPQSPSANRGAPQPARASLPSPPPPPPPPAMPVPPPPLGRPVIIASTRLSTARVPILPPPPGEAVAAPSSAAFPDLLTGDPPADFTFWGGGGASAAPPAPVTQAMPPRASSPPGLVLGHSGFGAPTGAQATTAAFIAADARSAAAAQAVWSNITTWHGDQPSDPSSSSLNGGGPIPNGQWGDGTFTQPPLPSAQFGAVWGGGGAAASPVGFAGGAGVRAPIPLGSDLINLDSILPPRPTLGSPFQGMQQRLGAANGASAGRTSASQEKLSADLSGLLDSVKLGLSGGGAKAASSKQS